MLLLSVHGNIGWFMYYVTEQKVGNVCVCVVTEFTSSCIFRNANSTVIWFLRRKMSHKVNV